MILVTGADGIVGRAVSNLFAEMELAFIPLVHSKKGSTRSNAIIVDLAQPEALHAVKGNDITAIVHLAAAVPHSVSYPDTDSSAELTRKIDQNILSLKRERKIPLVYMSTCGLYDRTIRSVKSEDDDSAIKIVSPYFSAKWEAEQRFRDEDQCTILRLAAPVGPGLKPNLVVARFIDLARSGENISLWGSGTREQNFIDTRDVANLISNALKSPLQTIVNAASQNPVTMLNLAETVIKVVGQGSIVFSGDADPREGEYAHYSIAKAYDLFNWHPEFTLEASCQLIVNENFDMNI